MAGCELARPPPLGPPSTALRLHFTALPSAVFGNHVLAELNELFQEEISFAVVCLPGDKSHVAGVLGTAAAQRNKMIARHVGRGQRPARQVATVLLPFQDRFELLTADTHSRFSSRVWEARRSESRARVHSSWLLRCFA